MMSRRSFLITVGAGLLAASRAGNAQPTVRMPRVGIVFTRTQPVETNRAESFKRNLRTLGWVDGQNVLIDARYADGRADLVSRLAAELGRMKVEVIVTSGTTAIQAARDATTDIPIVMAGGGDPVGTGLVATLARPGGRITGVSLVGKELLGKALELLLAAAPRVTRVVVLMNAANPANDFLFTEMVGAASGIGVQLHRVDVRSAADLDAAVARAQGGALQVLADPLFFLQRSKIVDSALRHRVPSGFIGRAYAEAGGLLSYDVSIDEVWGRAAAYVDKILKGAKPADLPVEQPTKFELVINLKTAKVLGLTIPPSLLLRANQVIE